MLEDFINVSISLEDAAIINAAFGVPLILDEHEAWEDRHRTYSTPAEMLDDGFETSDAAYQMAQILMSQQKRPSRFVVGRREEPVAQVSTVSIATVTNGATYTVTINGIELSIVADGDAQDTEIRDALIAAIQGNATLAAVATAALATASTFTVTSDVAGLSFSISVGAGLTVNTGTPNVGAAEDLAAIQAAGGLWWLTLLTSRTDADILEAAAWTEAASPGKALIAQSNDTDSAGTAYDAETSTDLASQLKQLGYQRTALMWHDDDSEYVDAAWAGKNLPEDPGTETWGMDELSGVTPADVSTTQRGNLVGAEYGLGKNANVYYAVTPTRSHTWRGTMASGQWIDSIRFADFLQAQIAGEIEDHVNKIKDAGGKVPMTDAGIQGLVNRVVGVLQAQENAGALSTDPKFTVTYPLANDISAIDRGARRLNPPIRFTARGSGAIHEFAVEGTITQ